MSFASSYRLVLVLLISIMSLTLTYSTVKGCIKQADMELAALESDWEDGCDDEESEQKENKTKERLDEWVEFSLDYFQHARDKKATDHCTLPLGKSELSAVHLEIVGPPPPP